MTHFTQSMIMLFLYNQALSIIRHSNLNLSRTIHSEGAIFDIDKGI